MAELSDAEKLIWSLLGTISTIEEHCRMRVQDWEDLAAQEVLDIINKEGEWEE